ncbi:battenin CLN3 protein [Podila epigama]|nr:battenin CLN3 protein [Podila epigama]
MSYAKVTPTTSTASTSVAPSPTLVYRTNTAISTASSESQTTAMRHDITFPEPDPESNPVSLRQSTKLDFVAIDRDWVAFFFINNLIYVVILSAAVDLVGSTVPKIIALGQTIQTRLVGVMIASLSSGLGELTFLMLSSFYRLQMVSAWSSGTGGAGLLGSLLFLALTSWIGFSIPTTLGVVAVFPIVMLFAYFFLLSSRPAHPHSQKQSGYQRLSSSGPRQSIGEDASYTQEQSQDRTSAPRSLLEPLDALQISNRGTEHSHNKGTDPSLLTIHADGHKHNPPPQQQKQQEQTLIAGQAPPSWDGPSWQVPVQTTEPTSINTLLRATDPEDPEFVSPFREVGETVDSMGRRQRRYKTNTDDDMSLYEKLSLVRTLLLPFMIPLFVVYAAHVWIPSFLQVCTLAVAILQALTGFLPWIYLIFALVLWEGLLGGSTYVHTYMGISRDLEHDPKAKEFALGVVGVADGLGITLAGLVSLYLEPALCRYQVVERGIELCLSMAD